MRKPIVVAVATLASFAGGFAAEATLGTARADVLTSGFVPVTPHRIYDSRGSAGVNQPIPAGTTITVATGINGAVGAVVNIAMTGTQGPGFLTVWASGASRPDTAIINNTFANENISNTAIVPVAIDGTFKLYNLNPTHIVVDLLGYFTVSGSTTPPVTGGWTATITGYGPGGSITNVTGTLTNGFSVEKDARVDVRCPNQTVEIDYVFDLAPGATKGWSVLCDGVFTSGATVVVVDV